MDAPKLIFGVFQFDRQNEGGRKRTLDICQESGIEELDCGAIYVWHSPNLTSKANTSY